jgi:phage-related protein
MSCGSTIPGRHSGSSIAWIADVFAKRTAKTPNQVIETARRRLRQYDRAVTEEEK